MSILASLALIAAGGGLALVYGARFFGALMTVARPLAGIEARPAYWQGGLSLLALIAALWIYLATAPEGPPSPMHAGMRAWLSGLFSVIGLLGLWRWGFWRVRLHADALECAWPPLRRRRARADGAVRLSLDASCRYLIAAPEGERPMRLALSMDGLDGLAAALFRRGARGLTWGDFAEARRRARRR